MKQPCSICGDKCDHPNETEWHWTQEELDAAEVEGKELAKHFEPVPIEGLGDRQPPSFRDLREELKKRRNR